MVNNYCSEITTHISKQPDCSEEIKYSAYQTPNGHSTALIFSVACNFNVFRDVGGTVYVGLDTMAHAFTVVRHVGKSVNVGLNTMAYACFVVSNVGCKYSCVNVYCLAGNSELLQGKQFGYLVSFLIK